MKSIHPFPARMAPDLALEKIAHLPPQSIVLDPMAGSGTVLRQAAIAGYPSIGFDMDPLAVLMTRVATSSSMYENMGDLATYAIKQAGNLDGRKVHLEWLDNDVETKKFSEYWFAAPQRLALRKLSSILNFDEYINEFPEERDALYIALSRLIITKEQRASLARDTSRSRPHRVSDTNDFDVFAEFLKSTSQLKKTLQQRPASAAVDISLGDARRMGTLSDDSIHAVITSPPYLNAIDYLRGHKLSLIWMGYSIPEIRHIRSNSIGAERAPEPEAEAEIIKVIIKQLGVETLLSPRHNQMIGRYSHDLFLLMKEIARVLKAGAEATFVVGNSCLNNVFIKNSEAVKVASNLTGLRFISEKIRELPDASRSLPMFDKRGSLSKRMRTENVIVFSK